MTPSAPRPQAEMPFLDHLEELRWRLFKIVLALAVCIIGAFGVLISGHFDVIKYLAQPIVPYLPNGQLVVSGPSDNFNIVLNASIALGVVIASPIVAWQIWGFLSPAMYKHEKKVVIPVLVGAALLFLAGMSLAFFFVLPTTLKFLLTAFKSDVVTNMMNTHEYFDFMFSMCIAFGLVFELPILILLLTALGILNPKLLTKFRRHAFVGCVVAAAFITPGQDPTSLFALTIPLYLLYEVSIVLSIGVYRGRAKRAAREAAEEAAQAAAG
ncbi:MAG: twin-arginine translocase subunit TatC [Gemmatimonadota bacterium]|nr:twin-arginine translocase subunit TatC [Gemmatimonadota bacterium]